MRRVVVTSTAVLVAVLLAVMVGGAAALPAAAAAASVGAEEILRFQDARITESSGVVVTDDWVVTTNDSGDAGQVFTVDRATGRTIGVTTWSEEPVDVEALAPASPTAVWVADIGDNDGERVSVTVTRVPIGPEFRTVERTSFELIYPGDARDAESLLSDPATGQLYVGSKQLPVGTLYAAPQRLQAAVPNVLREVGSIPTLATDGAFFPSGRHLVIRRYGRAVVYSFPALRKVGELDLPPQEQGEGIAVTSDNQLVLTSEGVRAPVLQIPLTPALAEAVGPPTEQTPDASESASPSASASDPVTPDVEAAGDSDGDSTGAAGLPLWAWAAAGGAVLLALVAAVVARSRRPGRPEAGV